MSYPVNPADGTATYWYEGFGTVDGAADQRAQDLARVTFTTPPLTKDVVVAGPTEVNLRAALSATDGNLVVRLMDVEPSGASIIVATGYLKASHRLGHERLAGITPDKLYDFPVHVWATHWRFAAGHRLRLSVSSGDVPRIEPDAPAGTVEIATGAGGTYADVPVVGAAPAADAGTSPPRRRRRRSSRRRPPTAGSGSPRSDAARAGGASASIPASPRGSGSAVRRCSSTAAGEAGSRPPRRALVVNLRGLPRMTVRVRLVVRTRSGQRFVDTRRYRTCAKRRRGRADSARSGDRTVRAVASPRPGRSPSAAPSRAGAARTSGRSGRRAARRSGRGRGPRARR